MRVTLEQDSSCTDIEVLVRYATMNKDVERISALLQASGTRIRCDLDGETRLVNASDIYYIESVDKRTFVYLERSVYRTDAPLYKLADALGPLGFAQINKACLLNTAMLSQVRPLFNSRMEATLRNGERVCITRKYLDTVKYALQTEARI